MCRCTLTTTGRTLRFSRRDSRGLELLRVVLLLIACLLASGPHTSIAEDLDVPILSRIRLTWVSMVNLTRVYYICNCKIVKLEVKRTEEIPITYNKTI